jgi:hypothetical protein
MSKGTNLRKGVMDRRNLLKSAAAISAAATAASRDWLLATLDSGLLLTPAGRVSTAQVESIRRTGRVFLDLDTANGGGHARDRLTNYVTDHVTPLLQTNNASTPPGRALFQVAAEQLQLLGMMSVDDGRPDLAQGWFTQALRLAQEAADPDVGAWCLAGLSLCALTTGDFQEARQLAAVGRHGAAKGRSHAIVAELHAYEARAEAGLGNSQATAAHALACQHALDRVRADVEPEWGLMLDDGYLASECALALAATGDNEAVQEHAGRSLRESRRRGWHRPLVYSHAALAHAAIDLHQLDTAAAEASAAVEVAARLQSSLSRSHIDGLRDRLSPHRDSPPVSGFLEFADLLLSA